MKPYYLTLMLNSGAFLAEILPRSPLIIFIFIIKFYIFWMKVSKKMFYLILKKASLASHCCSGDARRSSCGRSAVGDLQAFVKRGFASKACHDASDSVWNPSCRGPESWLHQVQHQYFFSQN